MPTPTLAIPSGPGKIHPYPGKARHLGPLPQHDGRELDVLFEVDRTANPHSTRAPSTSPALPATWLVAPSAPMTKSAAELPVPPTDAEPVERPAPPERLVGPALVTDSAGRQGGGAQGGVERRAGHRRAAGVGHAIEAGQDDPTAGRAHHHHVADVESGGHGDAEFGQDLQSPRTDEVATRLVSREGAPCRAGPHWPRPGPAPGRRCCRRDRRRRPARRSASSSLDSSRALAGYGEIFASEEGHEREHAGDPNRFAQQLFTPLPERYDRLAEVLSMGQNGRWRRAMVDHIVPTRPGLVLDVASGTAGVAIQLADRSPARVVGVDLTADMLRQGGRTWERPAWPTGSSWWPPGPSSCPSPTGPSTH